MMKLESEQEVLMNIADMAIETFVAESLLLRVMKLSDQRGEEAVALQLDMMRTYLSPVSEEEGDFSKKTITI